MIILQSVSKVVGRVGAYRWILADIEAAFDPNHHYVIFGQRGTGKTTLLRILSGMLAPTRGRVQRYCSVSPPIGSAGRLGGNKTGREIATFFATLYNADPDEVANYTAALSGLGDYMDLPISDLALTLRARLSHAMGYAVPCDIYLVDDTIGTGDADFRQLCKRTFESRSQTSGTIIATRDPRQASSLSDRGGFLHDGKLYLFDGVADAVAAYREIEAYTRADGVPRAEALLKNGEIVRAREYLKQHLSQVDDVAEAYELLADLSLKVGNNSDALEAASAALSRAPDAFRPHLVFAQVAASEGRFSDAIDSALKVLNLVPNHREARMLVARSYESTGMHAEAAAAWANLGPSGNNLTRRLAIRNYVRAGDWMSVLSTTEAALVEQKNDPSLLGLKARSLIELRRWTEAKQALSELVVKDCEAAITMISQLTRTADWPHIPDLLRSLPRSDPTEFQASRAMGPILTFLERKAIAAQKEGHFKPADELFQFITSIDPSKIVPVQSLASPPTSSEDIGPV